jgi:predicted nucleotidyltransferase
MSDDGLLDRAGLERAFTALGDRLVRRGVVADLFVVGGAAMALAYDAGRVTRDVDATFVPHGVVLEEARNVAAAMDLPAWWLNEQASAYVSSQPDDGKREVFDHPGIRVLAASAEHVFAMKAFAARSRDEEDLRKLAELVGITTVNQALRLCERFFPAEPLPPRSTAMLEDLFGAG